uniref:Uncharacterized protein n=1 Tax=Scleropages formosus TaxID=113540 RepID=A0A8C9WE63_SCLFO
WTSTLSWVCPLQPYALCCWVRLQSPVTLTSYNVNLYGRHPRKNPCLLFSNFAKEHEKKPDEYWEYIFWSDETKINLFGSGGGAVA